MRYRRIDAKGDMVFGYGTNDFYVNRPEAVAQAVLTRLRLYTGEWFLDITDGTDWFNQVLGNNTAALRDAVLQARIVETPGVNSILAYSSNFNSATRTFSVTVAIDTIYGVFPNQSTTGSGAATPNTFVAPTNTAVVQTPNGPVHGIVVVLDTLTALLDTPSFILG